jgi:hypothetical protein
MDGEQRKISFGGTIKSIQPRSNVWRYRLDNRTHSLTGYNLFLTGDADEKEQDYVIAISEKQQEKKRFHIGDVITGTGWTKKYPNIEYADYYRTGSLKKIKENPVLANTNIAPWISEVPALSVYDWRGCRMLDKKCWSGKCFTCKWAAMANVSIEYDWGISQMHRFETFCYGPKSCKLYKRGRARAVPDKRLGSLYDEGWLDDICTENRDEDE